MLVLFALAALAGASAAWTIAEPEAALRWAGVIAGYGLLASAARIASARVGAPPVAGLIALTAGFAGLVGLYGAGARIEPLAQRLGGQWSAGGPFEYSPALGLAQVSALPALLAAATARPSTRLIALSGAAGIAIAGSVLALAGSRVQLGLGIAVAAALVVWAPRSLGVSRSVLAAAAALAVTAGGLADAVAGGYVDPFVTGDDAPRLIGLMAIVIGAPALWIGQERLIERGGTSRARGRLAAAAVVAPAAAALTLAAVTTDSGPQAEPVTGFAHGRTDLWRAAADTALDRPLAGSGSQSFYTASRDHQRPPPVVFAHNLPLETWAELGLAGAAAILLLYASSILLVVRSARGPPTLAFGAWLLGPAVIAFLVSNLFDWPWHVPAAGAIFAIALGGLAGVGLKEAPTSSRSGR